MLNTTFAKLKEAGACPEEYRKLANILGGINKYGKNKSIPLTVILNMSPNGLSNALWALRCCLEPESERLARIFACDCARRVLHYYEDRYPDDKRSRKAIETARLFADGKVTASELAAARAAARDAAWDAAGDAASSAARAAASAAASDAARDAARDAAWDAARDAAWDAARATEIKWQTEHFKELIL